jgi:hypothetical protein
VREGVAWLSSVRVLAALVLVPVPVPYAVGLATRGTALPNFVGIAASPGVEMWLLGLYQLMFVSVILSLAAVLGTLAAPSVRRVVKFVGSGTE